MLTLLTVGVRSCARRAGRVLARIARVVAAVPLLFTPAATVAQPTPPGVEAWRSWGAAQGLDDSVLALTTWDPDGAGPQPAQLVAGGDFKTAGGVTVNHIARWDGSIWRPFGAGFDSRGDPSVNALTTWDPDGVGPQPAQLVAGGLFSTAGGRTVNCIARWDGSAWRSLGNGLNGMVESLTTWDPDGAGPLPSQLVAGGRFKTAGDMTVNCIARWDGSVWHPFGRGLSLRVVALTTFDPDGSGPEPAQLVAGGKSGGSAKIARWDGSKWKDFNNEYVDGALVASLAAWDPDGNGPLPAELAVGGSFRSVGVLNVRGLARWDGAKWKHFRTGAEVLVGASAFTTWDPDGSGPRPAQFMASGVDANSGARPNNIVARWDGSDWQALGTGFSSTIRALTTWDPDGAGPLPEQLVAGGEFASGGRPTPSWIAVWSTFDPVAPPPLPAP